MPVKFYLDHRHNRYGEAPIRVVWSFNGDRYQTTMGFSIPPESWNDRDSRLIPAFHNHKGTPTFLINGFIDSIQKAVDRMENYARSQNATLTKSIVQKVVADVLSAGGEFPYMVENAWRKMLNERRFTKERYFEHFKGGKYKLIGFGKNSETLEEVVVYQALYGNCQIWVRPYDIFFSKVKDENGNEVDRFKELTLK